jgi:hypothetical protein
VRRVPVSLISKYYYGDSRCSLPPICSPTTQNRLAIGKKVNTALDNPTNYFTAQSLDNQSQQSVLQRFR